MTLDMSNADKDGNPVIVDSWCCRQMIDRVYKEVKELTHCPDCGDEIKRVNFNESLND
jgi:hypothetical protein